MFSISFALAFQHWYGLTTSLRADAIRRLAGIVLTTMYALAPTTLPRIGPEPPAEMATRYRAIAADIASVAYHADEASALRRAAVLVAIARHEAGLFEREVDLGPCITAAGHCDHGIAVGLWQVQIRNPERRAFFQAHRRETAGVAMQIALGSMQHCPEEPFATYATGTAGCRGNRAAREIAGLFGKTLALVEKARREADDPYAD